MELQIQPSEAKSIMKRKENNTTDSNAHADCLVFKFMHERFNEHHWDVDTHNNQMAHTSRLTVY